MRRVDEQPAPTIVATGDHGDGRIIAPDGMTRPLQLDEALALQGFTVNTGRAWKKGGSREDAQTVPSSRPAPTLTGKSGEQWNLHPEWAMRRPATTVAGDSRVWPPGHKVNASDRERLGAEEADRRYGDRAGTEAVKLEVAEGLALQGFRTSYPVQGTKSKAWEQVGNAVPPPLAAAIVRHLTR